MRVDPETGNRYISAMVAKCASVQTTLVEFAGNGDSQVGRIQRDRGFTTLSSTPNMRTPMLTSGC